MTSLTRSRTVANIWVISDLHLGHKKVAEHRGFDSVEEHDAELVRNIRAAVKPDDHMIFCGDIASSNPNHALTIVADLPGHWHAVLGNHDDAHPMHTDAQRKQKKWFTAFDSVQTMMKRKIYGRTVMFSHFPYFADHTETPRHMEYRLPFFENRLLVHGHLHSPERYTSPIELHVGVDAWDFAPVPYSAIQEWVAERIESEREDAYHMAGGVAP